MKRAALLPVFCLLSLMGFGAAHAGLGGKGAEVAAESTRFKAKLQARSGSAVQTPATHTVYDMTLSDGTSVKQFARADGTIFAVSWSGHARPDLKTLFGDYFDRFQADNANEAPRNRRRALRSDHPDFVVRTFGRNGEVSGFAILPKLMPGGFDVQALQ